MVGKFSSTRVMLMPGYLGTGIIACLPVRAIAECAGISKKLEPFGKGCRYFPEKGLLKNIPPIKV